MKSFFKKLAFVMAMAMVVSLAAPAAAQADELKPLYLSLQGTTDKVEDNITIAPDKTDLDFSFQGAQSGWLALLKESEGWKSSNPAVATVDGEGKVTPVAEGETVISYQLKGYEVAKTTVTVKAPVVEEPDVDEPVVDEPEYGYDLLNRKEIEFRFAEDVSKVKKADVDLYRIFDANGEQVKVFWPINTFTAKENTITFSPFVKFGDGDSYLLVVNGEEFPFTTHIPTVDEITYVQVLFGTDEDAINGKASVSDEDTNVEVPVYLTYKLIYGTKMDVTDMFEEDVDVELVLWNPNEDDNTEEEVDAVDFDEKSVIFYDDVTATVGAIATYKDADNEEQELDVLPAIINPEPLEEFAYSHIVGWTIWDGKASSVTWYDQTTSPEDIKEVPAGKAGYRIVLLVADSRDGIYLTDSALVTKLNGKVNGVPVKALGADDSLLDGETWFQYYSTNRDTFLIEESDDEYTIPELTTYKEADGVVVYIDLHQVPDEDSDEDDTFVDSVYTCRFNIGEPEKFSQLAVSNDRNMMADALESSFVEQKVTVTPKIQAKYNSAAIALNDYDYEVKCAEKTIDATYLEKLWTVKTGGVVEFNFDGTELYEKTGKTSIRFTVKETVANIETSFTVTLDTPEWRDRRSEWDDENGESGFLATSEDMDAPNGHYYKDILLDTEDGRIAMKLETADVNLARGSESISEFVKKATVMVYKTSDDKKVGSHDVDDYQLVTSANWREQTAGKVVGQKWVALLDSKGNVVLPKDGLYTINMVEKTIDGVKRNVGFEVILTTTDSNSVTYAKDDTYTFAIYTVEKIKNDKVAVVDKTASFKVTDNVKGVTCVDRKAVSTTIKELTEENLKEIVVDSFIFNLGSGVWALDSEAKSTTVIPDGGIKYTVDKTGRYVIIEHVTFYVPVDGSTSLNWNYANNAWATVDGEDFYIVKNVKVDMSVELGVNPDED